MNPWKALFGSRKFILLVLDVVISLILYFVSKYLPNAEADVKFVILALQPIVIAIVLAIAYEDGKIIPAQISLEEAKEYNEACKNGKG